MRWISIFLIMMITNIQFCFSQVEATPWTPDIPNYIFEVIEDDSRDYFFNKELISDTLPNNKKIVDIHGVYIELLGRNGIYSLGYEFNRKMNKHGVGVGIGASVYRHFVPGKYFPNYNLNISPFYEYGKRKGIRYSFNTTFAINPIMFTDELEYLHPADRPSIYRIMPSNSLGFFYITKNYRYHFLVSSYLLSIISIRENNTYTEIFPWFGCTIKYNFKLNEK